MFASSTLSIVAAASEAAPFAKTGGLADVAGALPNVLAQRGHRVALVHPLYRATRAEVGGATVRASFDVPVGAERIPVQILSASGPSDRVQVLFVDCPRYFDREGLYVDERGREHPDNCQRFVLFSRAAIEAVATLGWGADVFHVHDWQTALVPVLLRTEYSDHPQLRRAASVLTIHNAAFQGRFPRALWPTTGLDASLYSVEGLEFWGDWSTLKGGVQFADWITTVSPTYAREICEAPGGMGLEGVFRAHAHRLAGIVNGIDASAWDPRTDRSLAANYDATTWRAGKRECKRALCEAVGLPFRPERPLIGIVGRMTRQKGLDVVPEVAKDFLELDVQVAALGKGEPAIEETMRQWSRCYPDRVHVRIAFDEVAARRIYAASDMFLTPSRFEPCGLSQLYAQRYGSVPIVHATGGLVDTVADATPGNLERGAATGFHFRPFGPRALVDALTRALDAHRSPQVWGGIVEGGMRADWSWDKAVGRYEEAYRSAIRSRGR
jgi:starch synthase